MPEIAPKPTLLGPATPPADPMKKAAQPMLGLLGSIIGDASGTLRMLTTSNPLSASQVQTFHVREFASQVDRRQYLTFGKLLPWCEILQKHGSTLIPKLHQKAMTLSAHRSSATGTRILIVDDNATMRRTLRHLLETQDDWKVCDEASDGREAVAKFDKEKFDVIVLDFQMPGMNGLDTARQIASLSPTTPILMVTLHNSPYLAKEARKIGIRGICPKADIECVVEGITTILDNKSYFKN